MDFKLSASDWSEHQYAFFLIKLVFVFESLFGVRTSVPMCQLLDYLRCFSGWLTLLVKMRIDHTYTEIISTVSGKNKLKSLDLAMKRILFQVSTALSLGGVKCSSEPHFGCWGCALLGIGTLSQLFNQTVTCADSRRRTTKNYKEAGGKTQRLHDEPVAHLGV